MRPRRRSKKYWLPWGLVGGLAVVTAAAAIAGAFGTASKSSTTSPPAAFGPPTGFGGYRSSGSVDEIGAQWRIPSVLSSSRPGFAATWIGAQSHDDTGPFVQLGSYSYLPPHSSDVHPAHPGPFYGIFWSDTQHHFDTVPIVQLMHAGDLISFRMSRNASGWKLTVHNQSFGWTRSLEVHYGADGSYNQGEWVEEDPASAIVTTTDAPFPDISTVSFERLRLNGRAPQLKYSDARALSTLGGIDLIPTHISHGSFALEPATGPARQFLGDAETLDSKLYPLVQYFLFGHTGTGLSLSRMEADAANSYARFADELANQSWPKRDRALVLRVEHTSRQLDAKPDAWGELTPPISPTGIERILVPDHLRFDTNRLRTTLGLPPT